MKYRLVSYVLLSILNVYEVVSQGLQRYYGTHYVVATGETRIRLTYVHGGPVTAMTKWRVECRDGEGLVGIRDTADDFEDLNEAKCRFLFPYKPPTRGMYPFYRNCHVRNVTNFQYHCFDPLLDNNTLNTFVVVYRINEGYVDFFAGIWEDDPSFRLGVFVTTKREFGTKIKCCQAPPGYYVDYSGCHYRYTHDQFYTYYDMFFYVVQCPDRYLMTGLGTLRPPQDENLHLDWIQCCPYVFRPESAATDFAIGDNYPDYTSDYMSEQYDVHKLSKLNKRFNEDALSKSEQKMFEDTKLLMLKSYNAEL